MRLMTVALGFLVLFFSGTAFAGDRGGLTVDKFGQKVTHACTAGENITVNGASNFVTLTGDCGGLTVNGAQNRVVVAKVEKLTVNGNSNSVEADAVGKISVNGSQNKVTWKRALDEKKAKPAISRTGMGNSVKKGE